MDKYKNLNGHSGVSAYEIRSHSILIRFSHDPYVYLYTYASTGAEDVEKMKALALTGRGLSTFISQNVRHRYETKFQDLQR
jgi:hypothetical protein